MADEEDRRVVVCGVIIRVALVTSCFVSYG